MGFNWGRALTSAGGTLQDYFGQKMAEEQRARQLAEQRQYAEEQQRAVWAHQEKVANDAFARQQQAYTARDPLRQMPPGMAEAMGVQPDMRTIPGGITAGVPVDPASHLVRQSDLLDWITRKQPDPMSVHGGLTTIPAGNGKSVTGYPIMTGGVQTGFDKLAESAPPSGGGDSRPTLTALDLDLAHGQILPQTSYSQKTGELFDYADPTKQGASVYPPTPAGMQAQAEAKLLTKKYYEEGMTKDASAQLAYETVYDKYGLASEFYELDAQAAFPEIELALGNLADFERQPGSMDKMRRVRDRWADERKTKEEFAKMVVEKFDKFDGKKDGEISIDPGYLISWLKEKGLTDKEATDALDGFSMKEARDMAKSKEEQADELIDELMNEIGGGM